MISVTKSDRTATRPSAQPAQRIGLVDFFQRSFVSNRLSGRPAAEHFYVEAIVWLQRALGRDPSLADLIADNLAAVQACVVACGFGRDRAIRIKKLLRSIGLYAYRLGLLPRCAAVPPPAAVVEAPAFLEAPPGPNTLRAAFETVLRPQLASGADRNTINGYAAAVHQFDLFLGRYATAGDVTRERLGKFRRHLLAAGRAESTHQTNVFQLRRLARILAPDRFACRVRKVALLPIVEPGSLRDFYSEVYEPQRMTACTWQHRRDCRHTLRLLYEFAGGDVPLSSLSDRLAADFFAWLLAGGRRPVTVNNHRAKLFAIWHLAAEQGRLAANPKVRKMPESLDPPDAWDATELARIVAAPLSMRWRSPVAGIEAGRYWHALMLVTYWTGLRSESVLKLSWRDVDLATGWINLAGAKIKNRRGQRLRIGADAIAALVVIREPERDLVFPWPHNRSWFCQRFRKIVAAAGVAPSTRVTLTGMHKLRRTTATIAAVEHGLAAASELLGHSTAEITKRYVDTSKLPGRDATEFLPMIASVSASTPVKDAAGESPPVPREMLRIARRLLDAGNSIAAACLTRIALERWLHHATQAHGCRPSGKHAGLLAHAQALRNARRLAGDSFAEIRDLAKPLHKAAHGHHIAAEKLAAILAVLDRIIAGTDRMQIDPSTPHPSQER